MSTRKLRTRAFIDVIKSLALENPLFKDIFLLITLGDALLNPVNQFNVHFLLDDNVKEGQQAEIIEHLGAYIERQEPNSFVSDALLKLGISLRCDVLSQTRSQLLLDQTNSVIRLISDFFHGDCKFENGRNLSELPHAILLYKSEINATRKEIESVSLLLADFLCDIFSIQAEFDERLEQALSEILSVHSAIRSLSIDLLAAATEASLVKLSLLLSRSERAFHNNQSNHQGNVEDNKNITLAISAAFTASKNHEKEMKMEEQSLDEQLSEYETLLQIIEGGSGVYQQIVNDWTHVMKETDECLKDLKRLGWTGD